MHRVGERIRDFPTVIGEQIWPSLLRRHSLNNYVVTLQGGKVSSAVE